MNSELKDFSGRLEKYLKENPEKAKAAWDKIAREHEERFNAWRDALSPEERTKILKDREEEVLHEAFGGPSAKDYLWHSNYTIRIHNLSDRVEELENGEKGKIAVILKHLSEGAIVEVKHRKDCDITCGRVECCCDHPQRQKELRDALASLKSAPPMLPLDVIMEGVAEGLACADDAKDKDPLQWIRSCLSRYRFIK